MKRLKNKGRMRELGYSAKRSRDTKSEMGKMSWGGGVKQNEREGSKLLLI